MPYRIDQFEFAEMMDCRSRVRRLFADEPPTLGRAAERVVQFFRNELVDAEGNPACALVRFFKTHRYRDLGPELRAYVERIAPDADELDDQLRCLTLLATAGDEEEWNSPQTSKQHRAIPLTSVEMVEKAPMISQLITQMGIEIATVVRPDRRLLLEGANATYNVFHVEKARGNPHIVAQEEFVARYGIESVLGFGGILSSGDMFATVLFSRVPISKAVADRFRIIGLNLKLAILPVSRKPLFLDEPREVAES